MNIPKSAKRGRPPGSKNKATVWRERLQQVAPQLTDQAVDLALSGDRDLLKFLLSRIMPGLQPAESNAPPPKKTADELKAIERQQQIDAQLQKNSADLLEHIANR